MEPTIYKPSIYKGEGVYKLGGGGGGGTNPDGSEKVLCIYNTSPTTYMDIAANISNNDYIKIKYRYYYSGNLGIFSLLKTGFSYSVLALNSNNYVDAYSGGISEGIQINTTGGGGQNYTIRTFENLSLASYKITEQNGAEGVATGQYQNSIISDKIRLFKGRSSYDSGRIEIFSFEVPGKIELTAAKKNDVPGFYDSISESFIPCPNNNFFVLE